MIRGLDASHFQGSLNWTQLRDKYHLSFAGAKCTEGTSFTDSQYDHNRAGVRAAGLKVIAYHYARPEASSAATQARRFVGLAGDVDALCLDLEVSKLNQSATNDWMRSFGDALHQLAPGVTTIAYLGGYAANGSGQSAVNHFDRWWYPRYPGVNAWPVQFSPRIDSNTTGWKAPPAPHIWQFTPDMGGMDANVSNLTVDQLFGDDMPTAQEIANAVWATALQGGGGSASAEAWLTQANIGAKDGRDAANVAVGLIQGLPDAVVAKLPPASTGGLTPDQVKQAVKDALKEGTA